jgi:uncharacterized tellurite resistance protein B-like protein
MKTIVPNLYIGLGSAVYALIKIDGQLQDQESLKARKVLINEPHGELAMQSFQLREHYQTPVEEAYNFAMRCFASHSKDLDDSTREYFIKIMTDIAQADERVSGKETEFIRRFRRDIRKV